MKPVPHSTSTHESSWLLEGPKHRYEPLSGSLTCDVVIVGAGITGLTAGLLLKREGKRVVILERDQVGSGTSGYTTAHLTTMHDSDYSELEDSFGRDGTQAVARSMADAIDRIEGFCRELAIPCDFARVDGYYYSEDRSGLSYLDREFTAAMGAGITVRRVDTVPLPFPNVGGFIVPNQARIHATKYLLGLASAFHGDGCAIYGDTAVRDFEGGSTACVRADVGTVRARNIILATHTPLGRSVLHAALSPTRSYVAAFEAEEPLHDALFWDTAEPYHYIRRQPLPGGREYILVGGFDHKTGDGNTEQSRLNLERYVRERFKVSRLISQWSAQFYVPADGLPYIGEVPTGGCVYVGTGFNGEGMTLGTVSGMVLVDLILDRANPYATLYRPTRFNASTACSFVSGGASMAKHVLIDRVMNPPSKVLQNLPRDTGLVVKDGITPLAVYRDEADQIHVRSAVCRHMKCIVQWNDFEKTWDCPCHGGRYSATGEHLEGPPLQNLTPGELKDKSEAA